MPTPSAISLCHWAITDCFSVEVEQRASAVAERDGRISLDVLADVAALESKLGLVPGRTG